MEILRTQQKTEMVKEIKGWTFPVGVVLTVLFNKFKEDFINADTDKKVEMYISAEGLTQYQYRELLKEFPYNEIDKLEKALA